MLCCMSRRLLALIALIAVIGLTSCGEAPDGTPELDADTAAK